MTGAVQLPCGVDDEKNIEICALHLPLAKAITGIGTDVKWLLRIGYAVSGLAAFCIVLVAGVLWPYFSNVNRELVEMRAQIAVNTAHVKVLADNDTRSESDRAAIHKAIDDLRDRFQSRR